MQPIRRAEGEGMTSIPAKRGNKFKAKRTACRHGHVHASGKEAGRCNDLHILQRAGAISGLEQQPVYRFTVDGRAVTVGKRQLKFTPDFRYIENGQLVTEDVKGVRTRDYIVRAAFFRAFHPDIILRET